MPSSTRSRRPARAGALLGSALVAAFGFFLAGPTPVAACSCAAFETMRDYATADYAVFTGTAGLHVERGVPVEIEQWLWGQGAAEVVWLADESFGDSASCGVSAPPPDSRWIWVAWLPGNGGDFGTGLCSPAAMLDSPEGEAMLKEAIAVFSGERPPVATSDPTPAAPRVTAPPDPGQVSRDTTGLVVGAAVVAASLALFAGISLVARRQGRGSGPATWTGP